MFAGIGYFSLPVADAGAYVHAMELNRSHVNTCSVTAGKQGTDRITVSCAIAGPFWKGSMRFYHGSL